LLITRKLAKGPRATGKAERDARLADLPALRLRGWGWVASGRSKNPWRHQSDTVPVLVRPHSPLSQSILRVDRNGSSL
jgi:hypothetical protein